MAYKVTLIPGDGIGPEISEATMRVIEAAGVDIEWERIEAGAPAMQTHGTPVPDELIASIKRNKVALKGPITTDVGKGFKSANVTLRKMLDLYVNFRPAKTIGGVPSHYDKVDLIIIRENTEDIYMGIENLVSEDEAHAVKVVTRKASTRIAKWAFEYARAYGRKKITLVHKANIMKITDGLFLNTFRDVAKGYPDIIAEDRIVDALCMNLVMDPRKYDMLLLGNLFGDIVSDLAAGLVGGLGVCPGANIGDEYAVFEAVHGSAPDIAGKNKANPTALILSAMLMLHHLGEHRAAEKIWKSIVLNIATNHYLTTDLGGSYSTTEFTNELIKEIKMRQ